MCTFFKIALGCHQVVFEFNDCSLRISVLTDVKAMRKCVRGCERA